MKKNIFKFLSFMSLFLVFLIPKVVLAATSTECAVAKQLYTTGYDAYWESGGDERTVREAMEKSCMTLPSNIIAYCRTIIPSYIYNMMDLMEVDTPVDEATTALGLCGSTPPTPACDIGQTLQGNSCVACPTNFYKETTGNGACTPCPNNGETFNSNQAADHDSITDCYILGGSNASGTFNFNNTRCNYTK